MKPIKPGPGQESVWDYPRPPALEQFAGHVRVVFNGQVIADTNRAYRVLETSHPPVFYLPPDDLTEGVFQPNERRSFCEWKGQAAYYDILVGEQRAEAAGWYYPAPVPRFAALKDHVAIYPSRMEACYVNDERVQAQEGDFYGGWVTKNIVGPFKGGPGTWGW